jgi:hypothetical protein
MIQEVIVKFEDDEDEQGGTPHRRVPSRYVIPLPSETFTRSGTMWSSLHRRRPASNPEKYLQT